MIIALVLIPQVMIALVHACIAQKLVLAPKIYLPDLPLFAALMRLLVVVMILFSTASLSVRSIHSGLISDDFDGGGDDGGDDGDVDDADGDDGGDDGGDDIVASFI